MRKSLMMGTSVLMAIAGFSAASAQEDTIIVTATKREQTLQEVPVAVSVVDNEVVADAQIIDVIDLQSVVPSLRVSQLERANNTTFIIRGLGNGANNPGIEPSVAVYIDGVFRSRSASALADFLDLERVEVLRGPQSTLFGKNSTAGVVNIVTREPSFDPSGLVEVTYGNYDQRIARAYLTGPLADNLAISLSGSINRRDGYTENLGAGNDINDKERAAVRAQLLFQPTDALEMKLIADWDKIDEVCCTVFNTFEGPVDFMSGPTTSQIVGLLGGQKQAPGEFDYEVFFNDVSVNEITNDGISLQTDLDLGNDITFTTITAYRTKEEEIDFEGDFTTLGILGDNTRDLDTETFTFEGRLLGETDRFSWLLGGFYFDESARNFVNVTYGEDTRAYADILAANPDLGGSAISFIENTLMLPSGTFFAPGSGVQVTADQENEQYSIFAQADINITDRLVLTLGASYYNDQKEVSISSTRNNPFSDVNLVAFGQGVVTQQVILQQVGAATMNPNPTPTDVALFAQGNPAAFAQIQAGAAAFAAANATNPDVNGFLDLYFGGLQPLGPITDFPNSVEDGSSEDSDVPYTIRLAYDLTSRTNVYASYATGYKASSWNLTQDSRPFMGDIAALGTAGLLPNNTATALGLYSGTRFAGPEETTAWEIGLKTVWDYGTLNVAVFDQTVEGFQAQTFQGAGFVLSNAGEQSVTGFEFEANIEPIENFTITWAGTYLDAEYDDFQNAQVPTGSSIDLEDGVPDGTGDLTGATPAGIPEFASSLAVKYVHDTTWGETFVRADWQYEDEVQVIENVPAEAASREVNTVNASLGVNWDNGAEALLWVRNLFEDEYYTSAFPTTLQINAFSAYPNPPRTYGVTLRKRF